MNLEIGRRRFGTRAQFFRTRRLETDVRRVWTGVENTPELGSMKVEGGIALFLPSIALVEVLLPTGLRSQMTIASGMLEVRD